MTLKILDASKNDQEEDQETEAELFDEICKAVRADDPSTRNKAQEWIDKIDINWKNYNARADETRDSPKVAEARKSLDKEIEKYENLIAEEDSQPPFLLYSSATENRFDDSDERKRIEQIHEAKHRERRADLEKHLTCLRECRENLGWNRARGTIQKMKEGTPESNFTADIVMMFKDFRPNAGSSKEDGDLHVLGEKVFKLITGKDVYFNLEHYLTITLRQYNAAKHNS